MNIAANIVRVIHILVVLFVVLVPFSRNFFAPDSIYPGFLLLLGAILLPWLVMHWLVNDSTCCLTVLESQLRGVPMNGTFMHSILDPVYRFVSDDHLNNKTLSSVVIVVTTGLWLKTLWELKTMQWQPVREMIDVFMDVSGVKLSK